MSFEAIEKKHKELQELSSSKKIFGKLSIRFCFDRKKPTVILTDGCGSIELSEQEFKALQDLIV